MQWYDYVRVLTAVLVVWSAWRLTNLIKVDRWSYTSRIRDFVWFFYASLFIMFTGAIESITRNAPYRYSALLSLLIAIIAIRATRPSDKQKGG